MIMFSDIVILGNIISIPCPIVDIPNENWHVESSFNEKSTLKFKNTYANIDWM